MKVWHKVDMAKSDMTLCELFCNETAIAYNWKDVTCQDCLIFKR